MKRIYSSRNLTHCDMVKGVLAQSGINAMLKNEIACATAGAGIAGALGFAWPEVWVNDEDEQTAIECLKDSGLSFLDDEGWRPDEPGAHCRPARSARPAPEAPDGGKTQ